MTAAAALFVVAWFVVALVVGHHVVELFLSVLRRGRLLPRPDGASGEAPASDRDAPAAEERADDASEDTPATETDYANAGALIGYIERFIVFCALLFAAPNAIVAFLAVKTAARFRETMQTDHFAEQFIVGTSVSVTFAALCAVAARIAADLSPVLPV